MGAADGSIMKITYLNRDGDSMRGALTLAGTPVMDAHAADKRYVDTLIANLLSRSLLRDGSVPMTGALVLPGAPAIGRHATTKDYVDTLAASSVLGLATTAYVDAQDVIDRAYADTQDLLSVPLDGSRVMTGLLRLSGAPVDNLDAATKLYVDAADALRLLLAGGTMLGMLTLSGAPVGNLDAATKLYVDTAIPAVSLSTYDAVVDAAGGGDYTTLVAACAGEGVGARIFIKSGTYNEVADVDMRDGQMLIGENPDDTIVDFGAGARGIDYTGTPENLTVANLTLRNSTAGNMIHLMGENSRVDNCRLYGGAGNTGIYLNGQYGLISRTLFQGFVAAGWYAAELQNNGLIIACTFDNCQRGIFAHWGVRVIGNQLEDLSDQSMLLQGQNCVIGNHCYGDTPIIVSGEESVITGNYFRTSGIDVDGAHTDVVVSGNYFENSTIDISNGGAYGWSVTGNGFTGTGGIVVNAPYAAITGNSFRGTTSIDLQGSANSCVVTGNNLAATTASPRLQNAGINNIIRDNLGADALLEIHHTREKNTSGGALAAGDVVVRKAVAAGDEVTTTVNQGDDMVCGMVTGAHGDNAYGYIQNLGKTTVLKVNGVVNIAIGDLLGTFTAAGISMKAAAGDMAFAIALEVYAGADSAGVIDALLITPRKV